MEIGKETVKGHIAWVDVLRIVACFLVIVSHSCDFFVGQFDDNRMEFLSGVSWGSLVRPCVPLFVMISGVLLLPIRMDMRTFYARRMKRIIIPLVFWSILLPVLYYIYVSMVNPDNLVPEEHTLAATLTKFYTFLFNFSYDTIPFWYLYMLIGLYLFMPILSAWLAQASQKDVKCFLGIWFFTLFIPYIQLIAPALGYTGNYGNMGLFGVCDWNPYGTFYYFSGFLGYIVLAHYLVKYPLNWSWGKTLGVAVPLFLAGYLITLFGFITMQQAYPGNYAYLEIVWYFSGINVFLMTFAVFITIQKLAVRPSAFLSKVASLTFGVYLCHFILVQGSYDLVYTYLPVPAYLQIPVIAVLTFCISLAVIWLMSQSKLLRKVIG